MFVGKMLLFLTLLCFNSAKRGLAQALNTTATIESLSPIYGWLDPSSNTTLFCNVSAADTVKWIVDGTIADDERIRNRGITPSPVATIDAARGVYRGYIVIPNTVANRKTVLQCMAELIRSSDDVLSSKVELNLLPVTEDPAAITRPPADSTDTTTGSPELDEKPKDPKRGLIAAAIVTAAILCIGLVTLAVLLSACYCRAKKGQKDGTGQKDTKKDGYSRTDDSHSSGVP